jgi:4-hydroxybenzoate polyprenyltransferase
MRKAVQTFHIPALLVVNRSVQLVFNMLKLVRVHQWPKNLFVFIPAFFGGKIFGFTVSAKLALVFLAFSFLSGCVYIINDLMDVEADRTHPTKRFRPLASGAIPTWLALTMLVVIAPLALAMGLYINLSVALIMALYFALNILYSIKLKEVAILDIAIIAFGFLLRVFAGGFAVDVSISKWLVLLTFLLAMLMALAKRRDEFLLFQKGSNTRKAISGYNLQFIDVSMVAMAAVTIVSYIMYTVSEEVIKRLQSEYVYLTTIFVVLGVMRYLQQTLVFERSGSPSMLLLKDHFIQIAVFLWGLSFAILLYLQ